MSYRWGHTRRFNAYSNYFKRIFGERIQKVSVNAGFTCPNRDGSLGTGGCTFCNNEAFNPSYCTPDKSITQQVNEGIEFHKKRYKSAGSYLVYFQAYSNTYGETEQLKQKYEEALKVPGVIGLVIGTRPDCINDELLDYFQKLSKEKFIIVEYGVESVYDETLKRINRGHNYATSVDAIRKTAAKGIKTGGHFIFGLPGETKEMMLKTAEIISDLPLNNVKFHQLQIIKNTAIGESYQKTPEQFHLFELEEYILFFCDFLERLNPNFVVERFAGEAPPRFLLTSPWKKRNDQLLNMLEKELENRDSWQGKKLINPE